MKKEIENAVEEACKAKLAELSLEIYSVEYKREGKDWILRVYIDRMFCEDQCLSLSMSSKHSYENPFQTTNAAIESNR